jgi:hypothetical protein
MIYAQFYHKGMITGKLIEAVGDRGVIILDGRNSRSTHRVIAAEECIKRKYAGYSLHHGESFTRSHLIEPFVPSQIWKIKDTVTLGNLLGLMQSGDKAVAERGWNSARAMGCTGTMPEVFDKINDLLLKR